MFSSVVIPPSWLTVLAFRAVSELEAPAIRPARVALVKVGTLSQPVAEITAEEEVMGGMVGDLGLLLWSMVPMKIPAILAAAAALVGMDFTGWVALVAVSFGSNRRMSTWMVESLQTARRANTAPAELVEASEPIRAVDPKIRTTR